MNNLDPTQELIAHSSAPKIAVASLSGSGKTKVLTERVRWLLNQGVDPLSLVAITFTNAAAEEMRERVGEKARGAFIGTIHSYANRLLLSAGIDTSHLRDKEEFDKLFHLIEENPQVIKPVRYLLVDEFQDIDELQYNFLIRMIDAPNVFVIGDDLQNIYSFRGSNPLYFYTLIGDTSYTYYTMENNYRSGVDIISFGMKFVKSIRHRLLKNFVAKAPYQGKVIELPSRDISVIAKEIKKTKPYKDWFILVRYNKDIPKIMSALSSYGIPAQTFRKQDLTTGELREAMEADTVKVITAHVAKGLENENVVVTGIVPYNDEERRLAYVAATRARKKLIWCYGKSFRTKPKIYNW